MSSRAEVPDEAADAVGHEPKLELVEHYLVPMERGRYQVRAATQSVVLAGGGFVQKILPQLFPLLDGTRTRREIVEALRPICSDAATAGLLDSLALRGLVREADGASTWLDEDRPQLTALARYLKRQGQASGTLAALRQAHVMLINGSPAAPVLASALGRLGVARISTVSRDAAMDAHEIEQSRFLDRSAVGRDRAEVLRGLFADEAHRPVVEAAGWPEGVSEWAARLRDVTMAVVLLDGPILFYPWLEAFNAAALESNVPWTSVALLDGADLHIGPTIRPGVTACYKCFELRFKSNLIGIEAYSALETYLHGEGTRVDFGLLPPVTEIVGGIAAIEVMRTISPDLVGHTSGKLMVFSLSDFSTRLHPVLKLPRCPACSPSRNLPRQRVWS